MNERIFGKLIVGSVTFVAFITLSLWLKMDTSLQIKERVPGTDGESPSNAGIYQPPEGKLIVGKGVPANMHGSWPCFRGPYFNNISPEPLTPIPKGKEFPQCWTLDVGEGHAGTAIRNGRVYLLDYDREKEADALRCLSLADGREIWRFTYPVTVKRNHGMSRTVPCVSDKYVVSLGPKCHVTCLEAISGEKKWMLDLVHDFGAKVPPWYAGQCPLIDSNNRVILAPGGSALILAIDCETGEKVWETPNHNAWSMTHSSIVPMMLNGRLTYVYCASGGVVGISALDGRLLWESAEWKIRIANVPSPLIIGNDRIFLCGGYGAGSMMLKLDTEGGKIKPKSLFRLPPERFGSAQHTPLYYNECIYGVRPDGQLVCLDLDGNEKWTSTGAYKFGLGPYMIVGSLIYVMDDSGLLSRVEVHPDEFRLLDQTQVLHGHDSWGPIAFASGRMILRDMTQLVCLEMAIR